jgi:hypothetical protein
MRGTGRCASALAAVLLAVGLTGCIGGTSYHPPSFSPDGSTVVRLRTDATVVGPDLEAPSFSAYNIFLDLFPAERPDEKRSVKVYSSLSDYLTIYDVLFSPDSEKVAIVGHLRLLVVDLKSGQLREMARTKWDRLAAHIISAAWVGNDEICYAVWASPIGWTPTDTREDWYKSTLGLYRQAVTQSQDERETIYEVVYEPPADYSEGRPTVGWSPGGRYVLFADPPESGPLTLVDARIGKRHPLSQEMKSPWIIAWRPDGMAALCYGFARVAKPGYQWLMVEPDDRKTHDMSGQFNRLLPDDLLETQVSWTADGQYVLIDCTERDNARHYVLVQPQPWQVIEIGKLLADKVRLATEEVPRFDDLAVRPLATCPVAGWLVAHAADGKVYLTDYHARRLHEVAGPAVSPDGNRVATYDRSTKSPRLQIRALKLPEE